MKMEKLCEFALSTFPSEETLNSNKNWALSHIIFNYDVYIHYCLDRDGMIGYYIFTTELLMDNLEKEEIVTYSTASAAMDVWPHCLAFAFKI